MINKLFKLSLMICLTSSIRAQKTVDRVLGWTLLPAMTAIAMVADKKVFAGKVTKNTTWGKKEGLALLTTLLSSGVVNELWQYRKRTQKQAAVEKKELKELQKKLLVISQEKGLNTSAQQDLLEKEALKKKLEESLKEAEKIRQEKKALEEKSQSAKETALKSKLEESLKEAQRAKEEADLARKENEAKEAALKQAEVELSLKLEAERRQQQMIAERLNMPSRYVGPRKQI